MRVIHGDCREVMAGLEPDSIDAVCSDPPYGLAFMGNGWDYSVPGPEFWAAALRVTKPGGHLLAFGGTRTVHRLACAIEDAGWELRDQLLWLYGEGMPKTGDAGKEIDRRRDRSDRAAILAVCARVREARDALGKTNGEIDALFGFKGMAGHWTSRGSQPLIPTVEQWPTLAAFLEIPDDDPVHAEAWRLNGRKGQPGPDFYRREVIGELMMTGGPFASDRFKGKSRKLVQITRAASEEAKRWEGWSATLKPGYEPIVLARKRMVGTLAQNLIEHGAGALNIRGCSIPSNGPRPLIVQNRRTELDGESDVFGAGFRGSQNLGTTEEPRWPANVILDEAAAADLDAEVGDLASGGYPPAGEIRSQRVAFGAPSERSEPKFGGSSGGPSRYFYTAKADRAERDLGAVENKHQTVKPIALMRWLVRLITPPGGVVLDPFAGSGSTLVAARLEGFDALGAELDAEHAEIARRRIEACGFEVDDQHDERIEVETPPQLGLFG